MFDEPYIRQIAAEILHDEITSFRTVYAGGMNFVYGLELPGRNVMLKVYPAARISAARCESEMLKAAAGHGIPVPLVEKTGILPDMAYLLYPPVPGTDLSFDAIAAKSQYQLCRDITGNLRKLAEIRFEKFGGLADDESLFGTWQEFLVYTIETGLSALAEGNHLPEDTLKSLRVFMKGHRLLASTFTPQLTWGDPKPENILVYNNQLSALLDFESCFSGDPLLALGYLFAREDNSAFYQQLAIAFHDFTQFDQRDIYFYALLRLLRIAKYLNSPLPTGQVRQPVTSYFPGMQTALNHIASNHG